MEKKCTKPINQSWILENTGKIDALLAILIEGHEFVQVHTYSCTYMGTYIHSYTHHDHGMEALYYKDVYSPPNSL